MEELDKYLGNVDALHRLATLDIRVKNRTKNDNKSQAIRLIFY